MAFRFPRASSCLMSSILPQSILSFWMDHGVDGFRVMSADLLYESADLLSNETRSCRHDIKWVRNDLIFYSSVKWKLYQCQYNGFVVLRIWNFWLPCLCEHLLSDLTLWYCCIFKMSFFSSWNTVSWRLGTQRFHLRVPDLQTSCSDLVQW